jgi:hypothetical protein
MRTAKSRLLPLAAAAVFLAPPVAAQTAEVERIPFQGGELTITETPEYEKVLAFDGRELSREYFLFFERTLEVAGTQVALFLAGPGGNACGASALMVWKPMDGEVMAESPGDDCGSPPPAATEDRLYFVPWLRPGESLPVRSWAPGEGFETAGLLTYTPQPDTGWATFDPAALEHPLDLFRNADVYAAAQALLGDDMVDVAAGLSTASAPDILDTGLVTARGCVPYDCGGADAFVAVDPAGRRLWFAQQGETDEPHTWPSLEGWPAEVSEAMRGAIGR